MKSTKKLLQILLAISLSTNLILGFLYYQSMKSTKRATELISGVCSEITFSGVEASSRLDEALETNDRCLALMAGMKLARLSGLLESNVCFELGVQNVYEPGNLSSLVDLIVWGEPALNLSPIGRVNDQTPFSAREIAVMEKLSSALKKFALYFYSETATENTYMYEERSRSSIGAINNALKVLQNNASDIW